MSWGLTPYDFVQQVFYAQEKVLLDFWPSDDKYKEVLVEANLVLQELQNSEDWGWLRTRVELGPCSDFGLHEIPEFKLPPWVYKPSTLHDDCVRLYRYDRSCHCKGDGIRIDERNFIEVPYISTGRAQGRTDRQRFMMNVGVEDLTLGCIWVGDVLTFNRPLFPWEAERYAVTDVQRRIGQLHVCGPQCKGVDPNKPIDYNRDENGDWINPCAEIEDRVFEDIPDPNYVVYRTAALHAEGSPPAQGRIATLTDTAQKLLSAMRQNDSSSTDADYIDWEPVAFVNVI